MSLIRADTDTIDVVTPPLSPGKAAAAIIAAESLDELLIAFALGASYYMRHIQIYARQRDELLGYIKIDNGMLDLKEIRAQHFPLEGASLISRVAAKGEIYVGPAPDTGPSAAILAEYGVEGVVDLALVPVGLKGRTFCLALGHDEDQVLAEEVEVALGQLAAATGQALTSRYAQQEREVSMPEVLSLPAREVAREASVPEAYVLDAQVATPATPAAQTPAVKTLKVEALEAPWPEASQPELLQPEPPQPEPPQPEPPQPELPQPEPPQPEPPQPKLQQAPQPDPPAPPQPSPRQRPVPTISAAPAAPAEIAALVARMDTAGPDAMAAAEALLVQGPSAVRYLITRFPGRLKTQRTTSLDKLPPVFHCSAVLKALAVLGRPVLEELPPLITHPDPDTRFFATYLLTELGCPEALPLLAGQHRDPDASVQLIGAFTVQRLREAKQLAGALEIFKAQTDADDPRTRKDAAAALGALGEPVALPGLVRLLGDVEKTVGEAANAALINLTKQDFKRVAKRWQTWWEAHRHRSRVEWLIDGLNHKDEAIRGSAGAELEVVRGKPFGFRPGMPKKERVAIQRQFREWWSFRQWWRENELGSE
jgi:HEAT repeat protein